MRIKIGMYVVSIDGDIGRIVSYNYVTHKNYLIEWIYTKNKLGYTAMDKINKMKITSSLEKAKDIAMVIEI